MNAGYRSSRKPWQGCAPLCLWCLRASRMRLLFIAVMVVAGAILLSCGGLTGNVNGQANTSPSKSPVPSPGATPPRVAEPKIITPAPTVVASGKGPRIAFTNKEIDFGDVQFEDVVRATFDFRNVGNEPLKILKTRVDVVEGC